MWETIPYIAAQAIGGFAAITTTMAGWILWGYLKGILGRFVNKQIDRVITNRVIFGNFDFNVKEWFNPRRRPYKKFGKRIGVWMRK